jgi:apolipoprotein N-acyltransferase
MNLYTVLLSILAGAFLGIGFLVPSLWFISLFAFLLIMVWMMRVKSARVAFALACVTGSVAYGFSFRALFFDALPFDWLGLSGITGVAVMMPIYVITVLTFAVPFGSFLTLAWRFRTNTWMDMLLFPSAFVVATWLGAWVFSIVNYGPFALIGPHLLMASLGYQLAESSAFLQVAWLGSIYALCFAQAFVGVLLYCAFASQKKRERISLMVLGALLLGVWIFSTWQLHTTQTATRVGEPINIAMITVFEPDIFAPSQEDLDKTYDKLSGILSFIPDDLDVVLLPEDSRFVRSSHLRGDTLSLPNSPVVIDSASTRENGSLYARIEYFDTKDRLSSFAYKLFLMPLGEEHPYIYQFLLRLLGQSELVDAMRSQRGFETKPLTPPFTMRGTPVAALLCAEGMSPLLYATQAHRGAQIFFNLSSHTWFHESRAMHTIAKWNSQVRAVESRRWFARSGMNSPSFLLDPYGRTVAEGQWNVESAIYGTAYPRTDITPYVQLGQRVLLVPILILIICSGLYLRRNKVHLHKN